MNHIVKIAIGVSAVVGIMLGATSIVSAQTSASPTGGQVEYIRSNCSSIKDTLSRVHANDGLVRVNHGRLYEQLSTKLMAPFNSRVVSSKLDGSQLVSATSAYERNVESFRSVYQSYDISLASVLKISCTSQPAKFYEELQRAQRLRDEVREAVGIIEKDIERYENSFDQFRKDFEGDSE